MRFLLYNISYGAGIGPQLHFPFPYAGHLKKTEKNFKQILQFIQSVNPDIIGLVEVDHGSFRSGNNNQADIIAKQLDYFPVFESKYLNGSLARKMPLMNKQGNAILVKNKVISKNFYYFTKGIKRLVIEVELENFVVFLVHLSLKFRHRHSQLTELYSIVKKKEKPVIVAGDFNALWGEEELELFLAATGLKSANHKAKPSYPSTAPKRQLDYICHSPEVKTKSFKIPKVKLSDHAPLIWDFEISGEKEEICYEKRKVCK